MMEIAPFVICLKASRPLVGHLEWSLFPYRSPIWIPTTTLSL